VLLILDEVLLRWFPPLRAAWAPIGEQAEVPITGQNAKRVLWGVINPVTAHRITYRSLYQRQGDFMAFLRLLRRRYGARRILLLLDKAPCHEAQKAVALAARLRIDLLFLPKQCPELNSMDHIWRDVKENISANRQYTSVDGHATSAERRVLGFTRTEALRKAGILSDEFWLHDLLRNFWLPT
jgi:transposase